AGVVASFRPHFLSVDGDRARSSVIKDAGDDPDVTHGAEVGVEVSIDGGRLHLSPGWQVTGEGVVASRLARGSALELDARPGVGVVTRPGLGLPVGGPAINPVPRRMISRAVRETLTAPPPLVRVTVAIEDGERLARRTLNGRLGIVGGLSILG